MIYILIVHIVAQYLKILIYFSQHAINNTFYGILNLSPNNSGLSYNCFLLLANGQTIFDPASPQAHQIQHLTYGFLWASGAILLLIVALTVYITIKFREKQSDKEPGQFSGNRTLELTMVGIPLLLVAGFFFWSVKTMSAVLPDRINQQPDIIITGHQWWWQAQYPVGHVSAANEIHLPVGKKILMQLNAADVIHDWWVPALGGKMDMIPGRDNYLWVTISKPGVFEGACSEFCGQEHAWMRIKVIAESQQDYNKWLGANAKAADVSADTIANKGKNLFVNASCGSCHNIKGTQANGLQGPDLTHFGSRKTMLAGLMDNTPQNLYRWLTDPQKVKPGANMPRFIFGKDSIKMLTAYLSQLK